MPNWNVTLPDPSDVNAEPRKETIEAPDEHSARIVAHERYGRQATEVSEHKPAKRSSNAKSKSSTKTSAKRTSSPSRKRASSSTNKRSKVERKSADPADKPGELNAHHNADPQSADNSGTQAGPEFKPLAPGGSDK